MTEIEKGRGRKSSIPPDEVQRVVDKIARETEGRDSLELSDMVALYLNPPDKALVVCVDEKSQIQTLDRTQPGLPMKKGRCGTMTHD